MLHITSVSKRFRSGNYGVRDVSFSARGGVLGLLGRNGAGKTTLMQMIATVTRPTTGRIFFRDIDAVAHPDALRRRLGYLPQDFGVYDNLTALEFLSYFAALKGVRSRSKVQEVLEMVNLHGAANRAVGGFSGGMKQRLGIAQALVNDPDLVIVDEPTAGLRTAYQTNSLAIGASTFDATKPRTGCRSRSRGCWSASATASPRCPACRSSLGRRSPTHWRPSRNSTRIDRHGRLLAGLARHRREIAP